MLRKDNISVVIVALSEWAKPVDEIVQMFLEVPRKPLHLSFYLFLKCKHNDSCSPTALVQGNQKLAAQKCSATHA